MTVIWHIEAKRDKAEEQKVRKGGITVGAKPGADEAKYFREKRRRGTFARKKRSTVRKGERSSQRSGRFASQERQKEKHYAERGKNITKEG